MNIFELLQYAIVFQDLHNFEIPVNTYENLFQKNYSNYKLPFESEIDYIKPLNTTVTHFDFKKRIEERERIDVWKDRNFLETRKENIQILDNYLTLCEQNKVCPIIFLPPMTEGYKKYFNRQKLDEFYCLISEAQKKHPSTLFIDGWKLQGFSDMYFADTDHLNIQGAAKFSTILNNVIENLEKG